VKFELLNQTILMTPVPNITIWFSYSTSSQLFGNGTETLNLTFVSPDKIQNNAYKFGTINTSLFVTLFPQESTQTCGELVFGPPITFIMIAIVAIGVISALAGHSMAIAWQALTVIQFVNYVPFMMIYSPSCMVTFSRFLDPFNAKIYTVLDWISRYKITRDDFYNEINHKFIRSDYKSSAIIFNALDLLIIWGIVLLLIPILYAIRRVFFNKSYGFKLQIDKFRNAVIYVLMLYSYMRLTFL